MKSGILIINKPSGMTSHDVVDEVRRITGERRVGHAGTLDPFATGVLVIGVGRDATRTLGGLSRGAEKRYRAVVMLGAESDTDDRDGTVRERENVVPVKRMDVQRALQRFIGRIQQTPPAYSAIKRAGVRAYERARRGERVELGPRTVTVHSITLEWFRWPLLAFDVTCSSGTYIRAIARDCGAALGTGGYLDALERTAVGLYSLQMAHTLEEIEAGPEQYLLPVPSV